MTATRRTAATARPGAQDGAVKVAAVIGCGPESVQEPESWCFAPKVDSGATDALRWAPTGRVWRLWFDDMPPSPNARMHHMAKAKVTKHWRDVAKWKALGEAIPPLRFVRISAVISRRALGVADEDNDRARLKPLVDGLRDAGVIPTDTRNYVEYGPVDEERGPKGIRLVIEEQALAPSRPAGDRGEG